MTDLQDVAAQWVTFGLQLGLSQPALDRIAGGRDEASNYLRRVLQKWLEGDYEPRSKKTLQDAVKSVNVKFAGEIGNDAGKVFSKKCLLKSITRFALHSGIPENFTIESLNILHKKLTTKLAANYQDIGIQLGLQLCEIRALSRKDVDVRENFQNMLDQWINYGEERDGADTLRYILQALESEAVNQVALANKLRKQWKDC